MDATVLAIPRQARSAADGEAEISAFLTHLAVKEKVSALTQNQALSPLLFLYRDVLKVELDSVEGIVRAQRPVRLPLVLSPEETVAHSSRSSAESNG
jgi:Phage integrase, N-terminal SAM-like domain